jgi:hypothetical protein
MDYGVCTSVSIIWEQNREEGEKQKSKKKKIIKNEKGDLMTRKCLDEMK